MLWSIIPNIKEYTKINEQANKLIYNLILQHPHVVKSPIANYFLKFSSGVQSEPHLVSKHLLQVSVQEINKIMVSTP